MCRLINIERRECVDCEWLLLMWDVLSKVTQCQSAPSRQRPDSELISLVLLDKLLSSCETCLVRHVNTAGAVGPEIALFKLVRLEWRFFEKDLSSFAQLRLCAGIHTFFVSLCWLEKDTFLSPAESVILWDNVPLFLEIFNWNLWFLRSCVYLCFSTLCVTVIRSYEKFNVIIFKLIQFAN